MRENQRKSRARKQEYIRELEQQLAVCKEQAQNRDIEQRLATQKVEAENRHLKGLLGSLGFSTVIIDHYLRLADQGTSAHRKVAIPALQRPAEASPTISPPTCDAENQKEDSGKQCEENKSARKPVPSETKQGPNQQQQQQLKPENPSLCECAPENPEGTWPSEDDVLNTTLCAMAEELINQYNTRGADIEQIRRKLWSGFRAGVSGDGCRVQNHILFQVLDDISNDV